ncbi:hypothetical protein EH221_07275 [bacterium]|nr:MAG: hypothetical protein EH221_07275 [bacterium]
MRKILFIVWVIWIMTLNAQVNIAVLDLVGNNVSEPDAKALTDRLRAELFSTGKFIVLEREKMDAILQEQQFQLSSCTSDACAVEVGQLLAVEQIVSGSVSKVGQTYTVTARLIGVEQGNLLGVGTCDLKGDIGDLLTCLGEVAFQLTGNQPVPRSEPARTQVSESTSLKDLPEMVYVKGGTFIMGDVRGDGDSDEKPAHHVTVSDFRMGKYEVTVAEFDKFISETGYQTDAEKNDGSYFLMGSELEKKASVNWRCDEQGNPRKASELNHPVIHVSWNDADAYCNWLSNKTGAKYRLPTEAEWEYAARSRGKNYKYAWGNFDPEGRKGGNIADESSKRALGWSDIWKGYDDGYVLTAPVGSFEPNELGLYDMTGNVWEWCWDWYGRYSSSSQTNPTGPSSGTYRVLRGGSWNNAPINMRCTNRNINLPGNRDNSNGFRFVRTE